MIGPSTATGGFVLGAPFLKQYYTYFNYNNNQTEFTPSLTAPTLTAQTPRNIEMGWIVVSSIVVVALVIVFFLVWIHVEDSKKWCYAPSKKPESQ
jgi:hypothetical protein